jgi:hypothetical protein
MDYLSGVRSKDRVYLMVRIRIFLSVIILSLCAVVAGCAPEDLTRGEATPASAHALQTEPALEENMPVPTETAVIPTSTVAPAWNIQPFSLASGVDSLSSYTLEFTLRVEGTDPAGKPASQSLQMTRRVGAGRDIEITLEGLYSGTGATRYYQRDGWSYLVRGPSNGEDACEAFTDGLAETDPVLSFQPEDLLGTLQAQKPLGQGVELNGLVTDGYEAVIGGRSLGTMYSQKGEVWLAQSGGLVVRLAGEAPGEFHIQGGKAVNGKANWSYELKDTGGTKLADLPAACLRLASVVQTVPLPEGALNLSYRQEAVTLTLDLAPDKAIEFFRQELPARQWSVDSEKALENGAAFNLHQGDKQMELSVSPGDYHGTLVYIR